MSVVHLSYWGVSGYLIFWLLSSIAAILFMCRVYKLYRHVNIGKEWDDIGQIRRRLMKTFGHSIGQWCQLKIVVSRDFSAISHVLFAWGFVIFFIYYLIFIIIGEGFGFAEALKRTSFHHYYSWVMDITSPLVMMAALWGIIQRYVLKPARLRGEQTLEALVILVTVLIHPVTHLFKEATGTVLKQSSVETSFDWPVFSSFISQLFNGSTVNTIKNLHIGFFWTHWAVVLFVLVFIGYSRYLHILAAPLNIALGSFRPSGALRPVRFEENESFGVSDIEDFRKKQLLESLSCMACGRCQDACPAFNTGKSLNPKEIVRNIKTQLLIEAPWFDENKAKESLNHTRTTFVEGLCDKEELWACTTCNACVESCPVGNNQTGMIMEMRRKLVHEGLFDKGHQKVLHRVSKNFNPWGISNQNRGKNLDTELLAREGEKYDCIYWLGCVAAFDDRIREMAQSVIKIMKVAGVKFAILGASEKCCGDFVRRIGDEGLFQRLVRNNIQTLRRFEFDFILTHCPHCFNSLRIEYPDFGGNFEVVHHSQLLYELLSNGRLALQETRGAITDIAIFHDPCYLGRYNQIFDEPRQVLQQVYGSQIEFSKNRQKSFCCGAGGGHIWIESEAGSKISLERLKEAMEKEPQILTTACPFCFLMFQEAIQIKKCEDTIRLNDIAEVIDKYLI